VHHSKKDDTGDARKAVRGSTAIFAAMDWCYRFESIDETPEVRRMAVTSIKACMGAKPLPVQIELTDKGLTAYDPAPRVTNATPEEDLQAKILLRLSQGPVATRKLLARAVAAQDKRVGETVDALVKRREVADLKGIGLVLDSDDARRGRVLEALPYAGTPSALAAWAQVDPRDVESMFRSGDIVRSADKRILAVVRD
jgi:hypothetical protein